jgi:hypothetical protein
MKTVISKIKCDACGAETNQESVFYAPGWSQFRMSGKYGKDCAHACSKSCLVRVLRDICEQLEPTPKSQDSSQPYR